MTTTSSITNRGMTVRVVSEYRYLAQISILRKTSPEVMQKFEWFLAMHGLENTPFWKVVHYKTPYISMNPIKRHSYSRQVRSLIYRIPLTARHEVSRRDDRDRHKRASLVQCRPSSFLVRVERHIPI